MFIWLDTKFLDLEHFSPCVQFVMSCVDPGGAVNALPQKHIPTLKKSLLKKKAVFFWTFSNRGLDLRPPVTPPSQ